MSYVLLKPALTCPLLVCFSEAMDVQAFERLLGPCMDIMKRNIANYEEQLATLFDSSVDIEEQNA